MATWWQPLKISMVLHRSLMPLFVPKSHHWHVRWMFFSEIVMCVSDSENYFLQVCFQCDGCHRRALQMASSPRCPTSGAMGSCSTRWSPSGASPFKASQTTRSFKSLSDTLLRFLIASGYFLHLIINQKCDDKKHKYQTQVLVHVKAGNTLTVPQGIKSQM